MIKLIAIAKISPHPNNPRKDLGELSELAESIKANGILQNLTIVPKSLGYCTSCKLYNHGMGKCTNEHDKNERPPCSKYQGDGSYTVIIGHRRLAAAKLAGLTEVPCSIAEMDEKTQVGTMLLENMQRSDLTVYEQAQGFQMMLDLGETIINISQNTGLSETTVRRRVKLLELDVDKFKSSESRGATMMDYIELDKIEDSKLRNSVLDAIGTSNFKYALQQAIDKEKKDKGTALLIEQLNTFASEATNVTGLRYVNSYYVFNNEFQKPEDAGIAKYFYFVSQHSGYITLYKEQDETQKTEEDTTEKERKAQEKARYAALEEITKRAYELRKDFIRNISNTNAKKNIGVIIEHAVFAMLDSYNYLSYEYLAEFLYIKKDNEEDWEFSDIVDQLRKQPERNLLVVTYWAIESKSECYFTWNSEHKSNENLDRVYDFIEKLGYEVSDEELALRNGTHKLFE